MMVCVVMWLGGCAAPGQVGVNSPQGAARSYPPAIEETPARRQAADEAWKQFQQEFRLPDSKPDLEPVLLTPRALPAALAGRIYLNARGVAFDAMEAKEALRRFLERARILLGPDGPAGPRDLSLASFADDGGFYRAVYQQASYPFPIANGYGELQLTVGKTGTLLQWSSRLIPKVELPLKAEVEPRAIAEKLVGREFSYADFGGQPRRYKAASRAAVSVKELVVYPLVEGTRLTIHLAYPIEVGEGMTWTVFVDAITGQELGVRQNFAS
jgi:hypothetical protein